ncbi:MAG: diguanylate cyclase [Acidobacteria bacterium]|nr:diguanylate cyclase [Acidobacteriota bacterium]
MTKQQAGEHSKRRLLEDCGLIVDPAEIGLTEPPEPDRFFLPALRFMRGGSHEKDLPILKQQLIIGRGEESDLALADPAVAREHILLSCRRVVNRDGRQQFRVLLKDLGSPTGTLVNSRRVQRAVLKPGDVISVGQALLRFEYRDLADNEFHEQVRRAVTSDSLTSLLNRLTILEVLRDETARHNRYFRPLSLLLLDMDDFRSLNDTFGRQLGDRILKSVSRILRRNLRRQDSAGRLEGEEFLIVQPETAGRGAAVSAERMRSEIERIVAPALRLERCVTASIGVASSSSEPVDEEALLDRAQVALKRAKALGKNRVEIWNAGTTNANNR